MTAQLIDGKAIAQKVREQVAVRVAERTAAGKSQPVLATVLVGDRPDSAAYVTSKGKACQELGMGSISEHLPADASQEQVEALVRRLADQLPELAKLKQGEILEDDELERIGATLNQADLFVTEDTLRIAFEAPAATLADFLRHILCEGARLPNREDRINAAFDAFIAAHGYLRANQLNFLRAVKAAVLRHGRITRAALNEPPLSRVGRVEALFPSQDIEELVNLTSQLLDEAA